MYSEKHYSGKFEDWSSELMADAVFGATMDGANEEWSADTDASVDWYGLVVGRRYAWIVHEEDQGFFCLINYGEKVEIRQQWEELVEKLEEDAIEDEANE